MARITYERTVGAGRERVFGVATDYESLQGSLPQYFPSVRIRSSRDDVTVVEQHLRLSGRELVMMTKHVVRRPVLHEVFVIGGDAKGSRITERYDEVPGGTRITVEADIGRWWITRIAGVLGAGRVRRGLAEITDGVAGLAEG